MGGCALLTLSPNTHVIDLGGSNRNPFARRPLICYHAVLMNLASWPSHRLSRVDSASAHGQSDWTPRLGGSFQISTSRFNIHRELATDPGRWVACGLGAKLHSHSREYGPIGAGDFASVEAHRLLRPVLFNTRVSEIRLRSLLTIF